MNIAVRSQGLVLKDLLKGILLKKRHFYVFILPYMFSDFFCRCFFTKKTFLCFHFPRMFPSGKQICQQLVVLNKSAFAERNFKQSSFKIMYSYSWCMTLLITQSSSKIISSWSWYETLQHTQFSKALAFTEFYKKNHKSKQS